MAWTEEKKAEVIAEYTKIMTEQYKTDEERGKYSVEVVGQLAEKHNEPVNGVRMILSKANVYFKKTASATTSTAKTTAAGEPAKRISKEAAMTDLKNAISAIDADLIDEEILSKLTGKAAAYFTTILLKVGN
jgi:hypothetical protein